MTVEENMQSRTSQPISNAAAIVLMLSTSQVEAQTPATSATPPVFHLLEATIDDVHAATHHRRPPALTPALRGEP